MAGIAQLLLVARQGPLADGLLGLLRTVPGVRVVGRVDEVTTSPKSPCLAPSVVVLAFGPMPEQDLAALTRLETTFPGSRFVVLADDVQQQWAAEQMGADAVLLKGCRPADLVAVIRELATARKEAGPASRNR